MKRAGTSADREELSQPQRSKHRPKKKSSVVIGTSGSAASDGSVYNRFGPSTRKSSGSIQKSNKKGDMSNKGSRFKKQRWREEKMRNKGRKR